MNWDKAIELLEKGEARAVVLSVVLLEHEGKRYLSFDGDEWEVTDSEMARREME